MKKIIKIGFALLFFAGISTACSDGYIDDITQVDPGEDTAAPVIEITNPTGNVVISYTETSTDFIFAYEASDDIELASVELSIDGVKVETYNDFVDYRSLSSTYTKNIGIGTHTFTVTATDTSSKSTTKTVTFTISNQYSALYSGEVFYLPFAAGNVFTDLINNTSATITGSPKTISGGYSGYAFQGVADSYISFPLSGLYSSEGISFTFWYKVDATETRAGIITINDNTDDTDENRNQGIRIFREGTASSQQIKANIGTGSGESWNDGGNIAVDNSWVHVAVTVSPTESKIYFNGELQKTASYTAFDLSTSTTMVIGSGAPSYTYWSHYSDVGSQIDEFRVYNKALTQAEVQTTME